MIHSLSNEKYAIAVKEHGAELISFKDTVHNLEYIWQADPAIWARHAPILFPIVGKLPHGAYQHQGQTYQLPQHGIARDLDFQLEQQSGTSITFGLTSSEKTKKVYPFSFRLQITYTLVQNALETAYTVQNTGKEQMLFSIGAHPAFNCPLLPGENFSDYYLEFEQTEKLQRYLLQDGLLNGATEPVLTQKNQLQLRYELFEKDAIVLKELASEKIILTTAKQKHGLTFEFRDFPYFGIWTKEKNAHFICLEPWHGIAGSVGNTGELSQKEGIIALAANDRFTCSYTIRVF